MKESSILQFLLSVGYALLNCGAKAKALPPYGVKLDLGPLSIDWRMTNEDISGHVAYKGMRYFVHTHESLLRMLAMAITELQSSGFEAEGTEDWAEQVRVLAIWIGQYAKPASYDYDAQEAFKKFGIATAPFMVEAGIDPLYFTLHQNDFDLTTDEMNKATEGCFILE